MAQAVHRCGQELELIPPYVGVVRFIHNHRYIDYCPVCGENLCMTDMLDLDGNWLLVDQQSEWSITRRKNFEEFVVLVTMNPMAKRAVELDSGKSIHIAQLLIDRLTIKVML